MKKALLLVLAVALVASVLAPVSAIAQTRNVTFIVNTATVPDTVAPGYTVQLRGNRLPLTWGNDTGGGMTRIGGDYWSKTLAFTQGDTIRFKIFVGTDGWEQNLTPDPIGLGGGDRGYIVASRDTVLPVQFFNNGANPNPQYWRPWTTVADTFMNVYFRVNMLGIIQGGLFGFNNLTDTVGIRGGGPAGGDLNWSPTFYLTRESIPSNGGSFGVPANTFWSKRVRIPKSGVTVGQAVEYKYLIGYDWGRDELAGFPNRNFVVPTGKRDTTIYFNYFNNVRPSLRNNRDTVRVTFLANLQAAISQGGFTIGDTVVVQTGFFGTGTQPGRQKQMIRQGVSTNYQALDTIVSATNQNLFYQYYLNKNGALTRENYYNFFYAGDVPAQAERREVIVTALNNGAQTVRDTATSIAQARRQPLFPNSRILARRVTVRWEVDIRPGFYQVAAGDSLVDIQGTRTIRNRSEVYTRGVWINGPATGTWQTWGLTLEQDTVRKMWDDGTHGDRVANDSIFSRIIVAAPESLTIGTKGQVGQVYKFGIWGGDNEGGRGGFGNNHLINIIDATSEYTVSEQFGSINPNFYNRWDFDLRRPRTTSVQEIPGTPYEFAVKQNYPNPFNPSTKIEYSIPTQSFVTLKVYNMIGQEVATLVSENQKPANYVASFNARGLASGLYFYKLTAGSFTKTQKMLLLK